MAQLNTRIILRNDSSVNWGVNADQVLLKGEVGIEFLEDGTPKIKIGDGIKTWAELSYFGGSQESNVQVYQITLSDNQTHQEAIDVATEGKALNSGDIAIIKDLIATGVADSQDKYEYTAYVYNGTIWAAMDGNYNAKNVYFDQDFTFTKAVGTVSIPSSGSVVVDAEGKNLYEFFSSLFAAESNPTKTEPSIPSLVLNKAGSYEAGTTVSGITYSATFEDGKYSYGPEPTGVEVESWEITDSNSDVVGTAASGNINDVVVSDNTNYYITAKATYSAGNFGLTNLGNPSTVQIAAGSKTKTSSAIKGYRNTFYGTFDSRDTELNSANIRTLTASGKTLVEGSTFTLDIPTTALRAVIAVPAGLGITQITHREGLGASVLSTFTPITVSVEGANGNDAINYDVYYADFNNFSVINHYDVTI